VVNVDIVLRNGTVVTEAATLPLDIAVRDGRIVSLFTRGERPYHTEEQLDVSGLHILPGVVDPHVHFSDQDQSAFEDFDTGTRAAAAGGVTTVLDMPLNLPPTVDAATFAARRAAIERHALVDVGLWAGLVPGNRPELPRMAALGAVAFKAFTCEAAHWFHVDDDDLLEGMRTASRLGLPVGVHCENNAIVAGERARLRAEGRRDLAAHAASRPEVAEWEAIARVTLLARVSGAATQVVHISTAEGVDTVWSARQAGARVAAEVTMHHLTLDDEEGARIGRLATGAPPLRPRRQVDALWRRVLDGRVQSVGSDHSPATVAQKDLSRQEHWDAPDGVTGVQTLLPLLLSEGVHARGLGLERVASLTAANPARMFGLYPRKGAIQIGGDADFAVVDMQRRWTLTPDLLFYKWPWSPHTGWEFQGRVVRTIVRGRTVYLDGDIVAAPDWGAFLSPAPTPASAATP